MGTKEKARQYAKIKGLTNYQFEKISKLTHGVLKSGQHFRADQLKQIRDNFPDINMDWFLYDEGEMLKTQPNNLVQDPTENYTVVNKDVEIAHLKEKLALQKITITELTKTKEFLMQQLSGNSKAS